MKITFTKKFGFHYAIDNYVLDFLPAEIKHSLKIGFIILSWEKHRDALR